MSVISTADELATALKDGLSFECESDGGPASPVTPVIDFSRHSILVISLELTDIDGPPAVVWPEPSPGTLDVVTPGIANGGAPCTCDGPVEFYVIQLPATEASTAVNLVGVNVAGL